MTETQGQVTMACTVCQKHKAQLHRRKSALKPDMEMFVCGACLAAKKEPRWLIILVGRRHGIDAVEKYLLNHSYWGPDILATDLVKTK